MHQLIELTGIKTDKTAKYDYTLVLKKSDIITIVKHDENIQIFMTWHMGDSDAVGYKIYRDTPEALEDYYTDLVSQWEAFLQYENHSV